MVLLDVVSCVAPIGIFFGRLANFINGELYGKPTDLPWAVIFPLIDNLVGILHKFMRHFLKELYYF